MFSLFIFNVNDKLSDELYNECCLIIIIEYNYCFYKLKIFLKYN